MTKPNLTAITIILDKSGSMQPNQKATIAGINKFIEEQKGTPGEVLLSLYQFNTELSDTWEFVNLNKIHRFDESLYIPAGGTALLDAIGIVFENMGKKFAAMKEEDRPSKVIVAIQTDGEENSSKKYSYDKIREIIKHQDEVYSWEVVFLGANQDAIMAGAKLGLTQDKCMTYSGDAIGSQLAFSSLARSVTRSRTTQTKSLFSEHDKTVYATAYNQGAVDVNAVPDIVGVQPVQNGINQPHATVTTTTTTITQQVKKLIRDNKGRFVKSQSP
jgi:hypothetical protein